MTVLRDNDKNQQVL